MAGGNDGGSNWKAGGELGAAISRYGASASAKLLAGGGEMEDQLRGPFETLLAEISTVVGVKDMVASGEHHLADERIRPDYAVHVGGALIGFVEIKAPGKGADPTRFKGHDKKQWERLACLPNVLFTDGENFSLYRDGERVGPIVTLIGRIMTSRDELATLADGGLERLFLDFLTWKPIAPSRPKQLAGVSARLCRLLRAEVVELLDTDEGLQALAEDWRRLLFPSLTEDEFADAYAQTVTFGLLLARVEGISLDGDGDDFHDVAVRLGQKHSLVGRALDLLTDPQVVGKLAVSITTLRRVLAVVDWAKVSKGREEAWLYFYEWFLEEYDPALRKATGSYYTPVEVVDAMVSLVDEALRTRLGKPEGFASPDVSVVDPCSGSGTYLVRIIEYIARHIEEEEGKGAVPARLSQAANRLVGFELQAGPYAVSELRLAAEFTRNDALLPPDGLRMYLADTLSNPFEQEENLGAQYLAISRSRQKANTVKSTEPVVVVMGNPPYREKSKGKGGWVEQGAPAAKQAPPLVDFLPPKEWGLGAHVKHLYNPYVYFWRWATWKVFDGHPGERGVVAFITVAGFLNGPGFAQMRDYLRRTSDAIWVIDCSPEGHQPEVATRVFQGVQQPVCIVLAVRDGSGSPSEPASVHFTAVEGIRAEKFRQLGALSLSGDEWVAGAPGWTDPLLAAGSDRWSRLPSLDDLLAWSGSGTMPGRTWVVGTTPAILQARWEALRAASPTEMSELMSEHKRDRTVHTVLSDNLPGYEKRPALAVETGTCAQPVRYATRSFDRQWIIPDKRVINQPNPGLWKVREAPGQIVMTALSRTSPSQGPAVTFTSYVPDLDHFHGRGGRAYPLWLDEAGSVPNLLPGLLDLLRFRLDREILPEDLVAYMAAVLASPAFVTHFQTDLETPGLRVPISADRPVFERGVALGRQVLELHTFGQAFATREGGSMQTPRLPADRRPKVVEAIPHDAEGMPSTISYEPGSKRLRIGEGVIEPVEPAAWDYEVSGMRVVKRWFDRRSKNPDGRRSSALDDIVPDTWDPSWTTELLELLNVLTLLADLEPAQAQLLDDVLGSTLIEVPDLVAAGVLPCSDRPKVEQPPKPLGGLFEG